MSRRRNHPFRFSTQAAVPYQSALFRKCLSEAPKVLSRAVISPEGHALPAPPSRHLGKDKRLIKSGLVKARSLGFDRRPRAPMGMRGAVAALV